MQIFVINMEKSKDRREYIEKHLSEFGINFDFFDAVDGRALSQEYIDSVFDKETAEREWKPMNRGEIGCSLSHMAIYEKMIKENIPQAIIFEDDIVLKEDFLPTVNALLKKVPTEIDIVKLGHGRAKFRWWQKSFDITEKYEIQRMYGLVARVHAYFITLDGAKKILSKNQPIIRALDDVTGDFIFGEHELYCMNPPLVDFLDVESTIGYEDEEEKTNAVYLSINKRILVRHFGFSAQKFIEKKRRKEK